MKRPISTLLFAAVALGCARQSPPAQPVRMAATTPMQTALVTTSESAQPNDPDAPKILQSTAEVAPPSAPAAREPHEVPLTPANSLGQPRPTRAQFVQSEPVVDKANSPTDQASVREIRELIAADKSLSVTSRQVTIVVKDGRVWLRGQVTTAQDRAALERLARQAGGVIDVRNELVVME